MDSPNSTARPKLHPLIATAAVAVILVSVVGIGALIMNRSGATPSPYEAAPVAQAAVPAPAPAIPARVASNQPAAPTYTAQAPVRSEPPQPTYRAPEPVARAPEVCRDCGVVDSIRDIKVKAEGSGVGAVGGAVVGGLLGNMVGAGRGKALATVGGAVAGGFGGNAIEKNVRGTVQHEMVVRLDNGTTRTFTQASPFGYSIGERVRIVDGRVERG